MKRFLFTSIVFFVLLVTAYSVSAESKMIIGNGYDNNIIWSFDSDGTLEISGQGEMGDYVADGMQFPDAPWGKYYTEIKSVVIAEGITSTGRAAFYNCTSLKDVTLPISLNTIDLDTFYGCSSLMSVTIPENVDYIGSFAFSNTGLKNVMIPKNVYNMGYGVFSDCALLQSIQVDENNYSLSDDDNGCLFNKDKTRFICYPQGNTRTTYHIPDSVTDIDGDAFSNCEYLTSVTISNSVTTIGNYAFWGCDSLLSITVPNSVTKIGYYAFADCSKLTQVTLSSLVDRIGFSAFENCISLKSIEIPNSIKSIEKNLFKNCTSLRSITIPYGVTCIDEDAFANCSSLVGVSLPNSITKIGESAFNNCDSLESIVIPASISLLGNNYSEDYPYFNYYYSSSHHGAFSECDNLKRVEIENGLIDINPYTFNGCSQLETVTIPNSVARIGRFAFAGCVSLSEIMVPNSVTSIESNAFDSCSSLTSFSIPSSLTRINDNVFFNCSSLTNLTISNSVTSIGECAFAHCGSLKNLAVPNSVISIESWAFMDCDSLESIALPDSITTLGNAEPRNITEGIFYGCDNLRTVRLGTGLSTIYPYAFYELEKLESVTIPNSVTSIGHNSFFGCRSLTSITIPDSVTSIGFSAFRDCVSLESIVIPNSVEIMGRNDISDSSSNTYSYLGVFSGCEKLKTVEIGNGLTEITPYAFYGCTQLNTVIVPCSITNICHSAFENCKTLQKVFFSDLAAWVSISGLGNLMNYGNRQKEMYLNGTLLENIVIPDGVITISDSAFQGCYTLNSVVLSNSVSEIEPRAFENCISLTSISISNSLSNIGYMAFSNCKKLKTIYISDLVAWVGISGLSTLMDLMGYGASQKELYLNGALLENLEIPNGVKTISSSAFCGCSKISSVTIPSSVSSIGEYAFAGCTGLTSVNTTDIDAWCRISFSNASSNPLAAAEKLFCNGMLVTSVTIPNDMTSIHSYVFYNCSSLTRVIMPTSVVIIGSQAFYECSNLTQATIPNTVKEIGEASFYGCSKLSNVIIPSNMQLIGKKAFYRCSKITELTIYNGVSSIGAGAFSQCYGLTSVEIPDSVIEMGSTNSTSINDGVFSDCNKLTSIVIGNGLSTINPYTFNTCTSLKYVTFGNNVTSIGASAFSNCSSLKNVTIPEGVTSVGNNAFGYCSSLTQITIPKSLTTIGNNPFNYCSKLTKITVNVNNPAYSDNTDGVLYNKSKTELICYPAGNTRLRYTIPDSVTSIANAAFSGCSHLTCLTVPVSMTSIGTSAFYDCVQLKEVYYLGNKTQWINIWIGSGNQKLTNAKIYYNGTDLSELEVSINDKDDAHYGEVTGTTRINFISNYYKNDSKIYDQEIGLFASQLCMLGYDHTINEEDVKNYGAPPVYKGHKINLENALNDLGFNILDYNYNAKRDAVNYYIASKEVRINNKAYTFIICACIGSHKLQWNSNFDPYGRDRTENNYLGYAGIEEMGITHLGFADARSYVWSKLTPILNRHSASSIKLLLTGHSRGAATANLLAADLLKGANGWSGYKKYIDKENLFAYTFATPNNTLKEESKTDDPIFERIYNIVNPTDFVTKVLPSDWGFSKYGTTYRFPCNSNYSTGLAYITTPMKQHFKELTGRNYLAYSTGELPVYRIVKRFTFQVDGLDQFYNLQIPIISNPYAAHLDTVVSAPFINLNSFDYFKLCICPFVNGSDSFGDTLAFALELLSLDPRQELIFSRFTGFFLANGLTFFKDAHCAESYCAYMLATSDYIMQLPKEKHYYTIDCPVDVEVYDNNTAELVGKIASNQIDEAVASQENAVAMEVDGEEKVLMLPADGDYSVKLIGNDTGSMDLTIRHLNNEDQEISRVNYFDIPLEKGVSYTSTIPADDSVTTNYNLTSEDGTVILPDEDFDIANTKEYTVTIASSEHGTVKGDGTYISGDYASMVAVPDEYYVFDGWYLDNDRVSTDIAYRFRVNSNVTLVANFKIHEHIYESDVTSAPTCIEMGVETYACACGDSYTEPIPATGDHVDDNNDGHCDTCEQQMTGGKHCKYCGKIHDGLFGWLVKFFHSILAIFKR